MKNILYVIIVLFMCVNFTSCTPENIDNVVTPQACCGDDIPIPPPPPPPPGEVIGG